MGHNASGPVARQFAGVILLIGMIASGLAAAVALAGRPQLSLLVCGGALLLALVILMVGGLVVASNQDDGEDAG